MTEPAVGPDGAASCDMTQGAGFDPLRPFTRAEGLAAGITPWQLRGREFARLPPERVRVASSTTDAGPACPRGAEGCTVRISRVAPDRCAALGGLGPSERGGARAHTARRDVSRRRRAHALRLHRARGALAARLPVTSPEETFADLGESLDLVQLVVLGDRLVRREVTSPARLLEYASGYASGRAGTRAAVVRRAAGLVRAGVDSPPESRLRMLTILAGLPEPTVNHIIRDPDTGAWLRRFELASEELRVAIEYEGRQHRDDDEIWASDIDRREELDRRAWRVVQVVSSGLFDNPLRTLQRIDQARVDRGAALTRTFTEEWRRFFPGREVA
jgi:hypothetical protein